MKKFFSILVLIALIVSLCSTSLAQTQPSIAGDLTADGKVTLADVLVTARYCIGSTTPSAQEILTADINATGNIELADVLLCARMAIGQMTPETADIYVVGPSTKLTMSELPQYTIDKTLSIELAKNESEATQFAIYSRARTYQNIVISATNLTSSEGNTLSKDNIKISREMGVYATKVYGQAPAPNAEKETAYPAPLIPMSDADLNHTDTKICENTIFQIDVSTTENTPSGVYTGQILLQHETGTITLPLVVTVWDFTLPQVPTYRTMMGYWSWMTSDYLQDTGEIYQQAVQDAYQTLHEYKMSVTEIDSAILGNWSDAQTYAKNMAEYIQQNPEQTAFSIPFYKSTDTEGKWYFTDTDIQKNLELFTALEQYGILDNAYIYVIDEPYTDLQAYNMKVVGDFLKEYGYNDKVHNLVTTMPEKKADFAGTTNTWCPILALFDPDTADQTRAEDGSEYWWYFCNDNPAPSYLLHTDLSNTRMNAWFAKRYDIKGLLYWLSNYWMDYYDGSYHHNSDMWSVTSGDPYLYQGKEGDGVINKNIVIPSLTCTAIRDSVEDFDYLVMLEQRVQEFLDQTGIELSLQQAMDACYSGLSTSLLEFATFEAPDNIPVMRRHIAQTILNGADYIMTEKLLSANGEYNQKKIEIYVKKGVNVSIDAELLSVTNKEQYDVYTYLYTFTSPCQILTLQIGENTYTRPMSMALTLQDGSVELLDLDHPQALELLKQANPHVADSIEIIQTDGEKEIRYTTNNQVNSLFYIPTQLLKTTDWTGYDQFSFFITAEDENASFYIQAKTTRDVFRFAQTTTFPDRREWVRTTIPLDDRSKKLLRTIEVFSGQEEDCTVTLSNFYLINAPTYLGEQK